MIWNDMKWYEIESFTTLHSRSRLPRSNLQLIVYLGKVGMPLASLMVLVFSVIIPLFKFVQTSAVFLTFPAAHGNLAKVLVQTKNGVTWGHDFLGDASTILGDARTTCEVSSLGCICCWSNGKALLGVHHGASISYLAWRSHTQSLAPTLCFWPVQVTESAGIPRFCELLCVRGLRKSEWNYWSILESHIFAVGSQALSPYQHGS